jgi:enamine deaminase RidA (YjgF/YER057c/UK114 family)
MRLDDAFAVGSFRGATSGAEHWITVQAPVELDLRGQIAAVVARYAEARRVLGLRPDSVVFRRLFTSDLLNQAEALAASPLAGAADEGPVAVSMVRQPPLGGAKLALLAYHIEDGERLSKRRLTPRHLLVEKRGRRHLWSTRLCTGATEPSTAAATQTREVFQELVGVLAGQGARLSEHCVRTWLFMRDVDVFYHGMVEARRTLFAEHGLTRQTHYTASTGIEGACGHQFDLVTMDAYSALDLAAKQVSYLNDFEHLCEAKAYNVTFERGTRIAYADRAHGFISGTASIDAAGHVLHRGDVLAQLHRALDNVAALLGAGAMGLADLLHLIVYLRDPADFATVSRAVQERCPGLPVQVVQAAVCRPDWLVEVEGVAVAANAAPSLPEF